MVGDFITAWYADYIFNEDHFSVLGGEFKYNTECLEINWHDKSIISSYPCTQETELQVQKIINYKNNKSMIVALLM
jgi:hypothetical protein